MTLRKLSPKTQRGYLRWVKRLNGFLKRSPAMATAEDLRRFPLHVLPSGFHRMRHYGLLANASRVENLARAPALLAAPLSPLIAVPVATTGKVAPATPTDTVRPCPCCGGPMVIIERFASGHAPRAPPAAMREAA